MMVRAKSPRATLADVARSAGVSLSTASRALHGGAGVSPTLSGRVHAAARDLGYFVNHNARSLRRGRDQAIGLVVEDFAIPFFGRMATAVERAARGREHGVVIACSGTGTSEADAVQALMSRNVAGLVVGGGTGAAPARLLSQVARRIPLVVVDAAEPDPVADTVTVDNHEGGRLGTAQLLEHGHREILFVGSSATATTVSERRRGYATALADAGVPYREDLVVQAGYFTAPVRVAVRAALARHPEVTAVFSSGGRTSPGALSAMADLGRRHMAFTGFDEVEGAEAFMPALTVVEQDVETIGREAVRLLFDRIADRDAAPRHVQVPLQFFVRGSGEAPPSPSAVPSASPALAH